MADAATEQRNQLHEIIKELKKLNETMGVISMNIGRYVDMIGKQPAKTNM